MIIGIRIIIRYYYCELCALFAVI